MIGDRHDDMIEWRDECGIEKPRSQGVFIEGAGSRHSAFVAEKRESQERRLVDEALAAAIGSFSPRGTTRPAACSIVRLAPLPLPVP